MPTPDAQQPERLDRRGRPTSSYTNYGFRPGCAARGGEAMRSKVAARRIVAGTSTGDRLYDADETELLIAVRRYQDETGCRFPTVCEIFALVKRLGYRKP